MKNQEIIIKTEFQGIILNVRPDEKHKWLLTTEEVAKGYGVTVETIRSHKSNNKDEILIHTHFTSVENFNAGLKRSKTLWTREGVIILGFFIKSEKSQNIQKMGF